MPESDKTLKILLQVQSDTADLAKVNAGLGQLKATTSETAGAAESLGASFAGALAAGAIGAAVFAATALFKSIVDVQQESTRITEEIRKQSDAISAQIGTWQELAAAAENFADTVKIGDKIAPQLAQAAAVMAKFRADELSAWDKFVDGVINLLNKIPSPIIGGSFGGLSTRAGNQAAQLAGASDDLFNSLAAGAQARDNADSAAAAASQLRALPAAEAIKILNGQIKDLTQNILGLDAQARPSALAADPESLAANERAAQQLKTESDTLERKNALLTEISGKQAKSNEQLEKTAAAATLIEDKLSGDIPKLAFDTATEKVRQLREEWQKLGPLNEAQEAALKITFTQTQANVLAQQQHTAATGGTVSAHRSLSAVLAQERLQLEAINTAISSVEQNPFLTTGQKNTALTTLIPQKIKEINASIATQRGLLRNTIFDPLQAAAARAAIQRSEAEIDKLNIKLKLAASTTAQFKAGLVEWSNSFGTVGQQFSTLVSAPINAAFQSMSSAITGLINRTVTWGQAFVQVGQAIIASIVQIFLQIIESQIASFIVRQVLGQAGQQATATEASAAAAAWAPGAIAASIASYGAAAGAGQTAFTLALLTGTAFATALAGGTGGFEKGGVTPGVPTLAMVGERGPEYVIDTQTYQRAGGAAFFDNLRVVINSPASRKSAASSSSSASRTSRSGGGAIHNFFFLDLKSAMDAHQKSTAYEKNLIQMLNMRGGHFRT